MSIVPEITTDFDPNSYAFENDVIFYGKKRLKIRDGLMIVRDLLRSGKLDGHFDMNRWQYKSECGSVGCIGGWCNALGVPSQATAKSRLDELFYPMPDNDWTWADIRPEHAADAIDNFLIDGDPKWPIIMTTKTLS